MSTWWDELKAELNSRLTPNASPYTGQQPVGRDIWGHAGTVDTHYPNTDTISVSPSAAWVDSNGNNALSIADWDKIVSQVQNEEELNFLEQLPARRLEFLPNYYCPPLYFLPYFADFHFDIHDTDFCAH